MLRTLFWVCWLFIYLIRCLPNYWQAKRLGRQGRYEEQKALVNRRVKRWSTVLLKHIRLNLTVEGQENFPPVSEPVVYVANHQSYIDIPVLLAGLPQPCALLAKRELAKVPLLRGWMDLLGCAYVDRDDVRASMRALKQCEEQLEKGGSVVVFPEGTRSKADPVGEFKGGAVRIAFTTGVRIVPVAVDGSWQSLESNGYKLRACNVRLVALPPIETKGLSRAEQKALPKQLEEMIRAAKLTKQ